MFADFIKKFSGPAREFGSLPFWSWNDKLNEDELRRQVREMAGVGHGGFFMHARDGLLTEYLSDEWFDAVRAAADEAKKEGIVPWCYDEEGWPSGSAGGAVVKAHPEYEVSWLRMREPDSTDGAPVLGTFAVRDDGSYRRVGDTDGVREGERVLCGVYFSDGSYIDVLNPDAVKAFIGLTHEKYLSECPELFEGGLTGGFFTDEPQYSLCRVPWSSAVDRTFRERHGYSVSDHVPALFFDSEGAEKVRHDFWSVVNDLYVESFGKTIYDWCGEHGVRLTGHGMMEDNLLCQMHCTAGIMPLYEFMHVPGIDWLGRDPAREHITGRYCLPVTPLQLGSAAAQLGSENTISETFALSGWDVSFCEMKWLFDWQMMYGVGLLCQHLEGYTIRGRRKADYPPSIFYQSPWWKDYGAFIDAVSREAKMLRSGSWDPDVLLIHPMHSLWIRFNGTDINSEQDFDDEFNLAVLALADAHVDFHFGDERLIRRHGSAKDGALTIGEKTYHTVILPSLYGLDRTTVDLLLSFVGSGGRLISLGRLPLFIDGVPSEDALSPLIEKAAPCEPTADAIVKAADEGGFRCAGIDGDGARFIHVTSRRFDHDGVRLYFLINTSKDGAHDIVFSADGAQADEVFPDGSSEKLACSPDGRVTLSLSFLPMQSRMIAVSVKADEKPCEGAREYEKIELPAVWRVADGTADNALMIEKCAVVTKDERTAPAHVYFANDRVFSLSDPASAAVEYRFEVDADPAALGDVRIVTEFSPRVTVRLNGTLLQPSPDEWWLDRSFTVYHAGGALERGENAVSVSGLASGEDDEIGYLYVTGKFGVYSKSGLADAPDRATVTKGPFVIKDAPGTVSGSDIVAEGFPFFRGDLCLEGEFTAEDADVPRAVVLPFPRAALVRVFVNGERAGTVMWGDFTVPVTRFVRKGENTLRLEIVAGNRNLLGPHHLEKAEPMSVGPDDFYPYTPSKMKDTFAFVKTGL
ncbi:MAG: hypothetical protein IJS78_03405 [Clostridia bacterium]|nr:hypothetical protein [Clostridia bacterium]